MKLDKKTLMPIIVLVSICIAVAALLGAVNMLTAPEIEKNALRKEQESLFEVFSEEKDGFDKVEDLTGLPKTVTSVFKAKGGKGYVISLATTSAYSSGDMTFVVGIDNDGNISGVKLNSYFESKDFGKTTYPQSFVGKTEGDYDSVDNVSGVTYSSQAFKSAIGDAFTAVKIAEGETVEAPAGPTSLARDESEVLAIMGELIPNSAGFTKLEVDGDYESLVGLYKENGGKGYAAYVLVISSYYGTVESEAVIHIENNGKVKNIKRLVWKTSDKVEGEYPFTPPSEDAVDEFYDRLNGASSSTIDGVLHISGATNTSGGVKNSFKEALLAADEAIKKDMPTSEEKLFDHAETLAGGDVDLENVTPGDTEYLRRLYKDKGGNGYFAYVVVISSNYGTVESEALIHIGNDRKIKDFKVLTWKTSDLIETPYYSFYPPSDETVDAFYEGFKGVSSDTVDGVLHISGATSTSSGVKNSFKEALLAVDTLEPNYAPRIIGIIVLVLALCGSAAVFVIFRKRRAPYEK